MATSIWKGNISFGLVSFPVKLFAAARSESVSFNQLHKSDGSRIKQVIYCQAEDKPVPRTEIVKGYEYEKGKYVVVEDEEIKNVAPKTAKVMEVLEFVKAGEIDSVYLDASYYLAPDEAGEKPYAVFFDALRRTGYAGIAKLAMHNREHIVILRPGTTGLLLHTMFYADEVRKTEEFRTDTSLVKDKEMELATLLVETLAAPFEPEKYRDAYRDNLMALIQPKVQGRQVVETPPVEQAKVIDILEALKQSLSVARKPPAVAAHPAGAAEVSGQPTSAPARSRRRKAAGE